MFLGVLSIKASPPEPFPLHSKVLYTDPKSNVSIHGIIKKIPSSTSTNDTYSVQLVDDSTAHIPLNNIHQLYSIIPTSPDTATLSLPIWLRPDSKVTLDHNGQFIKGYIRLESNNNWVFQHTTKQGKTIADIPLPQFLKTYRSLMDENVLLPGWGVHSFLSASMVSAQTLHNPCPPSLLLAIDRTNPDREVWFQSYTEEFKGITDCDVYEVITEKQYQKLKPSAGSAIPSM